MKAVDRVMTTRLGSMVFGVLFAGTLLNTALAAPSQSAEIEALKQQIRDLQTRVERLEGDFAKGVPVNVARKMEPEPGGWRTASNWKLLAKGMPHYEVKRILGEPEDRRSVRKFEYWTYGDGMLRLYMRRLKSWESPHGGQAN